MDDHAANIQETPKENNVARAQVHFRWQAAVNLATMTSCCCGSEYRPTKGKKLKEARRKARQGEQSIEPMHPTTADSMGRLHGNGIEVMEVGSTPLGSPRLNGFSEKEHIELRETFDLFDTNCDGKISNSELSTVIRVLRFDISEKDIEDMIKVVDRNENGVVDYDEYLSLMRRFASTNKRPERISECESDEKTLEAFRVFDLDGNGYIDKHELRTVMRRLGEENISEEDVRDMFREADLNEDGRIDLSEFSQILLQLT